MIRELCSCGAEFETDEREAVSLVKNWRRSHKHSEKPPATDTAVIQVQGDNQVALGFQALYDQYNDDLEEDKK
jgi:ubiquinone biosynthesis protein UbiJ